MGLAMSRGLKKNLALQRRNVYPTMERSSGGTLPHLCSEEILEVVLNKRVITSTADKDADQVTDSQVS